MRLDQEEHRTIKDLPIYIVNDTIKKSLLYDPWVYFSFGSDPARPDYTWTALPATTTAAIVCVPNDFFKTFLEPKCMILTTESVVTESRQT